MINKPRIFIKCGTSGLPHRCGVSVTWVFDLLSDIRVGEVPHQKKIDLINMKQFHVNMKFGPYMKYKKHFM